MTQLRINTPEALKRFLEILAEESVYSAYQQEMELQSAHAEAAKALDEADPEEKGDEGEEEDPLFPDEEGGGDEDAGAEDDLGLGDLGGDEDAEAAPEEEPMEEPPDDEGLEKQKQQGDAYKIKPTPLDLELGKISTEGIAGTLNLIRAGRSFKDADVHEQLRKYIESLTDAEQLAMATFLSALRDIAVGETAGEAPDPGEPEVDIKISSTEKEGEPRPQPQQGEQPTTGEVQPQPQQQQVQQVPQQPAGEVLPMRPGGEELEDTDAPIQVSKRGGVQLAAHHERDMRFRQHIREMLEQNR